MIINYDDAKLIAQAIHEGWFGHDVTKGPGLSCEQIARAESFSEAHWSYVEELSSDQWEKLATLKAQGADMSDIAAALTA